MEANSIYAVTYWNDNEEPVLTLFDNRDAAKSCWEYFGERHDHCIIDKIPKVYSTFTIG